MKRISYADLLDSSNKLQRDADLLSAALNMVANGKPDATETVYDGDQRYVYKLYGACRADGGIVVETFHCKGQRPYTAARRLDDYDTRVIAGTSAIGLQVACSLDRLRAVREQLLNGDDGRGTGPNRYPSLIRNSRGKVVDVG